MNAAQEPFYFNRQGIRVPRLRWEQTCDGRYYNRSGEEIWEEEWQELQQFEQARERAESARRVARQKEKETARKAQSAFPTADLSEWHLTEASPTPFLLPGFIPAGEVTLLTGPGGSNKSTFGQQLATCFVASKPMLGIAMSECAPALYVTAEDDNNRLQLLQQSICRVVGAAMHELNDFLNLASLRGRVGNELATFDRSGKLRPSPTYAQLERTIRETEASLVVLDNAAHFFIGNENDRPQVTAFINLLNSLCLAYRVTIVLIAHPNKAGDSWSGSTAWLNAVRSQIVISRPEDSLDPDERLLRLGKANYARPDQELRFRWHNFALVREADLHAASLKSDRAEADERCFLACLAARTMQRRAVSDRRSPTYAPTEFSKMAEGRGIGKFRFEAAMNRLFDAGVIERGELWRGDDRKPVFGLRKTAGNGAVNTVRPTRATVPEAAENVAGDAGDTHTYTYGIEGAAQAAAAPSGIGRDDE